jgi:hypothetical protein
MEIKFGNKFASLTDADPKDEIKYIVDGHENLADARNNGTTIKRKIKKVRDGYVAKIPKKYIG